MGPPDAGAGAGSAATLGPIGIATGSFRPGPTDTMGLASTAVSGAVGVIVATSRLATTCIVTASIRVTVANRSIRLPQP